MGKIKKKFQNLRLGQKILLSNLVLFVLPCMVLMLLLFHLVQTGANERLNSSKLVILNQIDRNMEDMFQDIVSYTNYFYCNRELNRLISLREFRSPYEELVAKKIYAVILKRAGQSTVIWTIICVFSVTAEGITPWRMTEVSTLTILCSKNLSRSHGIKNWGEHQQYQIHSCICKQ